MAIRLTIWYNKHKFATNAPALRAGGTESREKAVRL